MNITVCLQTCGEETERKCLKAIAPWKHRFIYQEVRNVTPASSALYQMISQCKTEYLVPLDADMILYPGFFDRWTKAITESHGKWHSILFPLWDTLTQERIMAQKIFRTEAVKEIPYKDDRGVDVQHYRDLTCAGYHAINKMHEEPIGDHCVEGDFFCYAKYKDLYMTLRHHPNVILESHFKGGDSLDERATNHLKYFKQRHKETGNRDYLFCIAGMVDGVVSLLDRTSKDLSERTMKIMTTDAEDLFWAWHRRIAKRKTF